MRNERAVPPGPDAGTCHTGFLPGDTARTRKQGGKNIGNLMPREIQHARRNLIVAEGGDPVCRGLQMRFLHDHSSHKRIIFERYPASQTLHFIATSPEACKKAAGFERELRIFLELPSERILLVNADCQEVIVP